MSHSNLPGWTVIRTAEDLLEHDPADPAYLLVPPRLVTVVGDWLLSLDEPGPRGARCRRFEELLRLRADAAHLGEGHSLPIASGDDAVSGTDDGEPFPVGDDADDDPIFESDDDGQLFEVGVEDLHCDDDEDQFFEGDREEPPSEGNGADVSDAGGLEDLWHDFSDELTRTELVDLEYQAAGATAHPFIKEQGHGNDTRAE